MKSIRIVSLLMMCNIIHTDILFGPENANNISTSNGWQYNSVSAYYEDNQPGWIGIWRQGFISKTVNIMGYHNIMLSFVPAASINYPLEYNEYCIVSYRTSSNSNGQILMIFSDDDLRTLYSRQVVNVTLSLTTNNINNLIVSIYNNGSLLEGMNDDVCYFRMITLYGDKITTKMPTMTTIFPTNTRIPTKIPTPFPSYTSTNFTTTEPTIRPTLNPTMYPTIKPTLYPSKYPTMEPTIITNILNLTTTIIQEISLNYTQNRTNISTTKLVNVSNINTPNKKLATAIIIIVLGCSILISACLVLLLLVIVHQQKIRKKLEIKQQKENKVPTQMVKVTSTTDIGAEHEPSIMERQQTRSNSGENIMYSDDIINEGDTKGGIILPPNDDYQINALQLVSYYID